MATIHYPALIEHDPRAGYGLLFPDLPGCVTAADSIEDLMAAAGEALELHLAGVARDGPVPPPTPLADVAPVPDFHEVGRVLVPATLPGRAVRINITVEDRLLARIDRAADAAGTSRSGWLARAASALLAADA